MLNNDGGLTVDDLITFLRDRLAEDEQTATAVFRDHTWSAYPEGGNDGYAVEGAHSGEPSCIVGDKAMANHIACHDPDRVLREVKAKQMLLTQFELRGNSVRRTVKPATGGVWDDLLRLLALPYSDHPQYQEAWRP